MVADRHYVRRTGLFRGLGSDGRAYTIIEYTHLQEYNMIGGERLVHEGLEEYRTTAGHPVNRRDDGTFQIVATGVSVQPSPPLS